MVTKFMKRICNSLKSVEQLENVAINYSKILFKFRIIECLGLYIINEAIEVELSYVKFIF